MYPKRMKSTDGGFTHAYSTGEEDQLRVHGWLPEDEAGTDGAEKIVAVTAKRVRKQKTDDAPVSDEAGTDGADNVQ